MSKKKRKIKEKKKGEKRKSRSQEIDTKGIGYLKLVLSKWVINELFDDYGHDFIGSFTAKISDKSSNVLHDEFYIQLKSTDVEKEKSQDDIYVNDLLFFERDFLPVIFARCYVNDDISKNEFHWDIFQNYIWDVLPDKSEWETQDTKLVKCRYKIGSLDDMKKEITKAKTRIIQRYLTSNGIGNILSISKSTNNVSELIEHKKRVDKEFGLTNLTLASEMTKVDNLKEALVLIDQIYNSKTDDDSWIQATFHKVHNMNYINDRDEIKKLIQEVKAVAIKLNLEYYLNYADILLAECNIADLMDQYSHLSFSKLISRHSANQNEDSFLELAITIQNNELMGIIKNAFSIEKQIEMNLNKLFKANTIEIYFNGLGKAIRIEGLRIQTIALNIKEDVERRHYLKQVSKAVVNENNGFGGIAKSFIPFFDELKIDYRTQAYIYDSLHFLYYMIGENELATKILEVGLQLTKQNEDQFLVPRYQYSLKELEERPYFYKPHESDLEEIRKLYPFDSTKPQDEYTMKEYADGHRLILQLQGIQIDNNLERHIQEINREKYYAFCENIQIAESTSMYGKMIGLPTIGPKLVWCKYGDNNIEGFWLDNVFEFFKQKNCENCEYKTPYGHSEAITVGWVKKHMEQKEFKEFLKNIKSKKGHQSS